MFFLLIRHALLVNFFSSSMYVFSLLFFLWNFFFIPDVNLCDIFYLQIVSSILFSHHQNYRIVTKIVNNNNNNNNNSYVCVCVVRQQSFI